MKTKKHFPGVRMWMVAVILPVLLSVLPCCGLKKNVFQSQTKENTQIEHERHFIDTHTKERIVTMYGVQMLPYSVDGDTVYLPVSYPMKKEVERDISEQTELWKIEIRDSILNAIDLKYRTQIDERNKKIIEFKQSTIMYRLVITLLVVITIIIPVLYMKAKRKS